MADDPNLDQSLNAVDANSQAPLPDHLPHDIKGLVGYAAPNFWPYLIAAIVLVLVGVLIWWLMRRRSRKVAPPIHPLLQLEEELLGLDPPVPFSGKKQSQFYFDLSWTIRRFIEMCIALPATDCTLKELKQRIANVQNISRDQLDELIKFFERADMIKFAGHESTLEGAKADLKMILSLARRLKRLHPDFGTSPEAPSTDSSERTKMDENSKKEIP